MATGSVSSKIIERNRKRLLEILQQDPNSVLDTLTSWELISDEEYETLENISEPLKKSRKLLILVQKKGEVSCQHFLKCLLSTFPECANVLDFQHDCFEHEDKNTECDFSPEEKQCENPETTVSVSERDYTDLEIPECFTDSQTDYGETAWSPAEGEEEYKSMKTTSPHLAEDVECESAGVIEYLQDGQRYEEPDESLYLAEEAYLRPIEYSKDAEATVEEGYDGFETLVNDGEEDSASSETPEFFEEEQDDEDSEASLSTEGEEESIEERKKVFNDVLSSLNLDRSRKLLPEAVSQFSLDRECSWTPETPADLAWNFLMKVQALDVTARDAVLRHRVPDKDNDGELLTRIENLEISDVPTINPLDVLCASLLCSDISLQREVMSNMHQCQFALPLLLPDAENSRSILMLGAIKHMVKQSTQSSGEPPLERLTKMPVISFVRLGLCSFSKSRILNTLLSPSKPGSPKIFFHQDLSAPVLPRQISDGLVEIAWFCPDDVPLKENLSFSPNSVAVANLRGDLQSFWVQFCFLVEISLAVFFFTDHLGEKEWDLLMFLGEETIGKCHFVLNPQVKESEEVQIFQEILNLKASQLLYWEEGGETGKSMKDLQAALQKAMSSSLSCPSLEDMAALARELGFQVDQDFENVQGIQVSSSENLAATADGEEHQRHSQWRSPSDSSTEAPAGEPEALQDSHPIVSLLGSSLSSLAATGGNSSHGFWKVPSTQPCFWLEQRSKWFCPSPFQNTKFPGRGKSIGVQSSEPQRFNPHGRSMNFPRSRWGHRVSRTSGRLPRPIPQSVQNWHKRPPASGGFQRSAAVVSQESHCHSMSPQPAGEVRKLPSRQTFVQGPQLTGVTGKSVRPSHSKHPPPHALSPPGGLQKTSRPISTQGTKMEIQGGLLNPTIQMEFCSKSNNTFIAVKFNQAKSFHARQSKPNPSQPQSSQPNITPIITSSQSQPSQVKYFSCKPTQKMPYVPQPSQSKSYQHNPSQSNSSQPHSSQSRPSQTHASQSGPSQAHSSQSRPSKTHASQSGPSQPHFSQSRPSKTHASQSGPSQPHSSQSRPSQIHASQSGPSQTHSSQSRPSQPHFSQSRPSQQRPTQPKSPQTHSSQTKAQYSRAGPNRAGKR